MRNSLTILVGLLAASGILAQENPAPIPVVKTWRALQALPPIDLGGGVNVRLGLEADKGPQGSGALLYGLTEGYTPASSGSGVPLGPVRVSISFGDGKTLEEQVEWGSAKKDWAKGSYLFVRALPFERVGEYRLRVTHSKSGTLLAEASIAGTNDFFHPWMPWFFVRGIEELAKSPPLKGIALPAVERFGPIDFVEPGKIRDGNLPTLLPGDGTPKLTINVKGDDVVIRSEKEMIAKHPQYYLLARWWVNDKPFVPMQSGRWMSLRRGIIVYDKELTLPLRLEPALIGAKTGDRIGLQILYCESEWDWCTPGMRGRGTELGQERLRLSNRIEFIAGKGKCD